MIHITSIVFFIFIILSTGGCATVEMESKEVSDRIKSFAPPSSGNAGLYIFRAGSFGGALKKDIRVNERCVGESAPNTFFYHEVAGDQTYKISTESEFSPNDLLIKVEKGLSYFIRQYIKLGIIVGGAGLELVDEAEGKKEILSLALAKSGKCGD